MRSIVMLLVAAAAIAGRAEAQPAPWQPERLTPGWVFTPGMGLGGMWDSNVTVRNEGNPLLTEWVGIVSPRGELDYNGRRLRFNAGYSGSLETYREFSELNRYEQRARLSSQYRHSPRLTSETRVSYTVTPTTDRLELGTLPFIDIGGRSFDAGGGFSLHTSPRTEIGGEYRFQHLAFNDADNAGRAAYLAGGYAHSPLARLRHSFSSRLSVGGEWQYRLATVTGGLQNFHVQTALGEVTYHLGPNTSVSGAGGVDHLDVSNTGVSLWGPSIRGSLEHQLDRTMVSARFSRSFVPSFSFGGLTSNLDFGVSVRAPLTRSGRLTASGSVLRTRTEPVEQIGVGFRLDSTWMQVSVGYQLAPWLRTDGFVSRSHQTTTVRGNFERTRVGIQFVTFKPVRIQ